MVPVDSPLVMCTQCNCDRFVKAAWTRAGSTDLISPHQSASPGGSRVAQAVQSTIQFPYKRSLGPVVGAFMTALTDRRIIGIRSGDRVIVPPLEWDPDTAEELAQDFVDVGPAGTVVSWSWVATPTVQHPLPHPFAFALVQLDGADTSLLHAVDA